MLVWSKDGFFLLSMILLIIIWLSTFFIQVPIHNKLLDEPSNYLTKLVRTNWIRTVLWTVKAMMIIYYYMI